MKKGGVSGRPSGTLDLFTPGSQHCIVVECVGDLIRERGKWVELERQEQKVAQAV